ncbi:ADP-ribose pyrophosphatase [Polaromonas sp. OV174]|uniref:NUDIX domain-containing protein n=1 Tax=Polaromonas sp. OV174 TaxID=1855300 RepID=UPI0008E7CB0E|nr:NUDIX hydrolase [Polaromonas sp. OV174]SFB72218.1 ADP-ribose pyrophosphatase [Polaromonas sp. OV174]
MKPVCASDGEESLADGHLLETRVSSEALLKGHFLHVWRDTVGLPDGSQATREYVIHPGAVMIVAQLDDGRLVLERQYRYPVQAVMIEFPAGKLDAGEASLACAQRELLEETGYSAREWAKAGVLHPVISYSTEFIDIWFARGLTLGERKLDAGEFLDVFAASPAELLAWCGSGRVTDSKTLTGALWLQNVMSGAWQLDWQVAAP